MLVYHGSNIDIEVIDLTIGIRYKDFGQGFYVTPDIETAQRMAKKKVSLFGGEPTVITYEFDETVLASGRLKALVFPEKATAEWIQFVDDNRNRRRNTQPHGYDIVKGPIADDGVALQLGRLRVHADSAQAIAADLQDKYLDQQIYFGTPASLEYLKKIDRMQSEIVPTHHQMAELLTDDILSEMTAYLMEDYGYPLEKALDIVYTSKTIELLQKEEGELYVQSPAYVYELLLKEIRNLREPLA